MTSEHDLGPQPLDELLTRLGVSNADLVRASTEQLSFKVASKARKGRRLTPNLQRKVLRALKTLRPDDNLTLKDLFNY